jgi:hypothetical protein
MALESRRLILAALLLQAVAFSAGAQLDTPVPVSRPDAEPTSSIVGGTEINPSYKYPFLVSLRYWSSHTCGGSLIETSWVLTAAHCISAPASVYSVLLHAHSKSTAPSNQHRCTEIIPVQRIICHPSYNSNTNDGDVCLLQLARAASCGEELRTRGAFAHLDTGATSFATPGHEAIVAGWGATHTADGHAAQQGVPRWPDTAREVAVPLLSNDACKLQYRGLTPNMLCAGRPEGGIDSCQGDSGGPLFVMASGGRAYQVGVVSFGVGCGLPSYAGVYARVTSYRAWIVGHVPSLGRPAGPPPPPNPPSPPRPPPPPPTPPMPPMSPPGVCLNTCRYASDSDCDDGGAGSEYSMCQSATDCTDCGIRAPLKLPPPARWASPPPPSPTPPPIAGVSSPPPPSPSPPPPVPATPGSAVSSICQNDCRYSSDGDCDDGGDGSEYTFCSRGTDCVDCGERTTVLAADPPPSPRPPPPSPSPPFVGTCSNACNYASDGDCDDGSPGAEYSICSLNTDCADCGTGSAAAGGTLPPPPVPSPPPPSRPPLSPGGSALCGNACSYAFDNDCDDGGSGSEYSMCELGTDCDDCAARGVGSISSNPGGTCTNACSYASDGDCDDGGSGAEFSICDLGTGALPKIEPGT